MKIYVNPPPREWAHLSRRPVVKNNDLRAVVSGILSEVRSKGDLALRELSVRFDGAAPASFRVSRETRDLLATRVQPELVEAITQAIETISRFHDSQRMGEEEVETVPGVVCFRRAVPIDRVGIYIPGGSAPLFSTLLMLAIPAKIAGVREIALCTPGGREGSLNEVIACAAKLLAIDEIYLIGGAQAIGALAYGTETVPAVQKICGPGNSFVTEAKLQVAAEGTAIDMPAGPSEVLVIADGNADPRFVAADLLAQAEHGPDSQVVVVTNDQQLLERVLAEVDRQVAELPRGAIASKALGESLGLVLTTLEESIEFSNAYAPEHLILSIAEPERYIPAIRNAGSVFLGYLAAEALGDYASGTNHVLPTNGAARALSGVSLDTFVKKVTFQRVNGEGLSRLSRTVACMAQAEGLEAHARAVLIRQEVLNGK
jgi:histidinol dehydrogenase